MSDIRQKSVDFLSDSIAAATGGQAADSAAQQLEQAIYDKAGQSTSNDYRGQVRSIGLTLKKDNVQLAQDVMQGRIAPTELVNMSQEVSPPSFIVLSTGLVSHPFPLLHCVFRR